MKLYRSPGDCMSPFWIDKLEQEAGKNWDKFYKQHGDAFFKDRHYLDAEFPELRADAGDEWRPRVFAELGCGAGNTVLPLLETNPTATVFACDYSPRAVALTQQRAAAAGAAQRCHAFVCDITREPLVPRIPAAGVDVAMLVFALSACSPETMAAAAASVAAVLARPHGCVCVRDYAAGDLAEERLAGKGGQKLGERFYARSDGTRCYYFCPGALEALFHAAGLVTRRIEVCERQIVNRARALKMDRRWVQAVFCWPQVAEAAPPEAGPPEAGPPETEADGAVSAGGELAAFFAVAAGPLASRAAAAEVACGGATLRLRLVGREWQHTERATGSMLWEGARALAQHISARPGVVAGARCLELGAGAAALPSHAAAAAGAAAALATDGHAEVLSLLADNVAANGVRGCGVRVEPLRWGSPAAVDWLGAEGPLVLLGADVVYDAEALPLLFRTAAEALRAEGGSMLLCHVDARGGTREEAVLAAAAAAGLALRPAELDESAAALLRELALPPVRLLRGGLAADGCADGP